MAGVFKTYDIRGIYGKGVDTALAADDDHLAVGVTLLGGAFGRKSKADFSAEAAWLARETGKPVKVSWTREDDIRNGYLHTVSAQYLKAALDAGIEPPYSAFRTALNVDRDHPAAGREPQVCRWNARQISRLGPCLLSAPAWYGFRLLESCQPSAEM